MINIIDRGFNFLGQIDSYESFIFTKSYSGIGSFELHLNDDLVNTDKLIKENIIFTSPKKAYVILHREINSKDGKLVIKGKELKSYLARSPIFPPTGQAYYRVNSNVETIMKTYVQSTLTRKGITNIVVAANQNRGDTLVYQTRYKNLADELEKLSLASNLGWDIALDLVNKKFVLDVVEGQDRTASQTILPPAIFSVDYDNIAEQTFVDSKLNYANVAIVAGQGEGADRAISIVGDATGLDSYEIFVDARDIENNVDLPARGNAKLSEHQEVATFDSQVLTDKNLVYEEDFNLGDTVTVQNKKWNVTLDTRINAVTEIYESSGFRLDITFGSNIPEITDIIKQATDTPIAEGRGSIDIIVGELTPEEIGLIKGPKGDKGDKGDVGLKGDTGERGPQGIEGPKGERGIQGIQGIQGMQGERGLQGETGTAGAKGDKGDKGDTGASGGTKIITNATEPNDLATGDQWHREY